MSVSSRKNERVDLRITKEDKELLDQASRVLGLSLSSYILSVILKQARFDLIQNERLVLSNQDRELLLNALNDPAEPNEALKGLFRK